MPLLPLLLRYVTLSALFAIADITLMASLMLSAIRWPEADTPDAADAAADAFAAISPSPI